MFSIFILSLDCDKEGSNNEAEANKLVAIFADEICGRTKEALSSLWNDWFTPKYDFGCGQILS